MIPIIFNKDATVFTSHGIGDLIDCASCSIAQTTEGEYEGKLLYPYDGALAEYLVTDNIVVLKPNPYDNDQAFRIYGTEKSIDGTITCKLQHISYDLNNYISAVYSTGPSIRGTSDAVFYLKRLEVTQSPFTYVGRGGGTSYDVGKDDADYQRTDYTSCRDLLFNGENSIKQFFENDVVFDNYTVTLAKVAGVDRGVIIEYGVNLTDMRQEINLSNYHNAIFPYWFGKDPTKNAQYYEYSNVKGEFVFGPILYVHQNASYYVSRYDARHGSLVEVTKTLPAGERSKPIAINLTEYFTSLAKVRMPTRSEIEEIATTWAQLSSLGIPEINITLNYVDDGSDVRLNDAVTVVFTKLGIQVKAKVVKYTYDVLQERYTEIELGSARGLEAWQSLYGTQTTADSRFRPRMSPYVYGTWG